ncbi:MAG TPA: GldG family protein [Chthoniobacterales bacterium]|nr:GldG family protein [Chthoniobacterales bacterium]
MADDVTPARTPKKIHRFQIGLNVIIQLAIVIVLAAMVNYLGFEHYRRWDYSRDKKYALSDRTTHFLDALEGKVRITVFFASQSPIYGDVQSLLTEYQYASHGKIDVEYVDPERSLTRAKELLGKYKVVTDESVLILDYKGRNKSVKASEMAETSQGNPMTGEEARITAFKGEQAITGALLDVVEGKKNVVGYVLGHKEPPLSGTSPIAVLKTFIENENVQFKELNLFEVPAIPEDIKVIMIAGPQYDFSDREMKMLRDFWNKDGRILLLVDPAAKTPKLSGFLAELGVKVDDDRLMAMVKTGIQEIARVRDVVAHFLPDNPVTQRLVGVQAPFLGSTSTLTLQPPQVMAPANIHLTPLAEAEQGYWGEMDYYSDDEALLQPDPKKDKTGTLIIAAAVEKGGSADQRVQINSARLIVVANSTFIHDDALTQGQQGLDFVSASLNWLLNREQLIGIAPKIPEVLTFTLEANALRNLRWIILVIMPLFPALIGLGVWWRRRA